jgi:ADP-ribosylglycohydrolase
VLLNSVHSNNGDVDKVAQNFYDWLTTYTGRNDGAGKEFYKNYSEGKKNPECGADDNQAQCLYKAVIAVGTGIITDVEPFVRFHQNNDVAVDCGHAFAKYLLSIKTDKLSPRDAFDKVFIQEKESLPESIKPHIQFLQSYIESSDTKAMLLAWADEFNKTPLSAISCFGPAALLRSLHISIHATSYEQGLRNNILIGGDYCSVALALGAVLGYHFGVPRDWTNQVSPEIVATL